MYEEMDYEWDANKRIENIRKHGLDFEIARFVLADPNVVVYIDNRKEYGEIRYIAYGAVAEKVLCVCYTARGQAYRIISLRKTHEKERSKYYDLN
jgi:uncharacterized DUF497 family protein